MTQLSLFPVRHPPARRLKPSDPEIWEAVLHPEGKSRLRDLMRRRHGGDRQAVVRDLEEFRAPTCFRDAPCDMGGSGGHWAGWIHIIHHEFGGELPS